MPGHKQNRTSAGTAYAGQHNSRRRRQGAKHGSENGGTECGQKDGKYGGKENRKPSDFASAQRQIQHLPLCRGTSKTAHPPARLMPAQPGGTESREQPGRCTDHRNENARLSRKEASIIAKKESASYIGPWAGGCTPRWQPERARELAVTCHRVVSHSCKHSAPF